MMFVPGFMSRHNLPRSGRNRQTESLISFSARALGLVQDVRNCVTLGHVHHWTGDSDAPEALRAERMLGGVTGRETVFTAYRPVEGDSEKSFAGRQWHCHAVSGARPA